MADASTIPGQAQVYALSLKQPWATLLAYGCKTIEVRSWPTVRRGPVLIHAARVPDLREEVWSLLPAELKEAAQLRGGIMGAGELTECIPYRTLEAFVADRSCHLNDPSWFHGPVLYGFRFAKLEVVPFWAYPGWLRFFPVDKELPRRPREST